MGNRNKAIMGGADGPQRPVSLEEAVGRFFREVVNSNGYSPRQYEEIVHLMAAAMPDDVPLTPEPEIPPATADPVPEECREAK